MPGEFNRKTPEQSESFDERIDQLFEELSFASQHGRPSILLVFYESEAMRHRAEGALEKRLAEDGQALVPFRVDESHFDIPLLLSQRLPGDRPVFSVTGLSRGGGKEGANAYRALNIRREYFVDYAMRVVIWLDPNEAMALSRHAPDFWAFRHRVVEFNDVTEMEQPQPPASAWAEPAQAPEDIDKQITWYEQQLGNLNQPADASTQQIERLFRLAGLYTPKKPMTGASNICSRASRFPGRPTIPPGWPDSGAGWDLPIWNRTNPCGRCGPALKPPALTPWMPIYGAILGIFTISKGAFQML